MKSLACTSFWRLYVGLPEKIHRLAQKNFELFMTESDHPELDFKKLQGTGNYWSLRVGSGYRAVGLREGDTITWLSIGSHVEYGSLF